MRKIASGVTMGSVYPPAPLPVNIPAPETAALTPYVSVAALRFGQFIARLSRNKDPRTGNQRGFTFARIAAYAKMFGRCVRTIKYWVDQLRDAQYIETRQDTRTKHLHIYPRVPERVFTALLTPLPVGDPSLICAAVAPSTAPKIAPSRSHSSIGHTKEKQQPTGKSKPDPVSAPLNVVVSEINNEELETVQSLEAKGVKPVKALELVLKHGSPLCRRHLEAYSASTSARGVGWLISRIENNWSDDTRRTPGERLQLPYSDPRPAPRVFVPAEPVPVLETGTGREAARAFMDKRRGGVSFGGWKGR